MAHQRHPTRVTVEGGQIFVQPMQPGDQIHQAKVALCTTFVAGF
jgi:hypothetical protein